MELNIRKLQTFPDLVRHDTDLKIPEIAREARTLLLQAYVEETISSLRTLLCPILFLCEFCQVHVRHCTNMDSSVILTHGSQILCFRRIQPENQL